jgi:hypothetical protein
MSGYNSGKLTDRNYTITQCIPKKKHLNTNSVLNQSWLILSSFNDPLSNYLGYVMSNGKAIREWMNEWKSTWMEAIVAYFKLLDQNFPGGTVETAWITSVRRTEPKTSQIQNRRSSHSTAMFSRSLLQIEPEHSKIYAMNNNKTETSVTVLFLDVISAIQNTNQHKWA